MKLDEQVCSLELAKKLESLGVKQESYFYWMYLSYDGGMAEFDWAVEHDAGYDYENQWAVKEKCSAFTVAELGEMLPHDIAPQFNMLTLVIHQFSQDGKYGIAYRNEDGSYLFEHEADTEADARAKMLCYLLENKLMPL